jgi:hypothetical protein
MNLQKHNLEESKKFRVQSSEFRVQTSVCANVSEALRLPALSFYIYIFRKLHKFPQRFAGGNGKLKFEL